MAVIAVKPELLVWAREYRGLTLPEAAKKLSMSESDLAGLEGGSKPLTLTYFRRISGRYRIPGATLLRRTPPPTPPLPKDFRTIGGKQPRIGFEARLAISYARTIEQNILELVEADAAPPLPSLAKVSLDDDPAEAGERERSRLGVSVATQLVWRSTEAFNNWRAVIEKTGAYVVMQKYDLEDCRGFTLYENPNAPIIVLNKAEDYAPARIYTLIHEYCHLLLREPGISDVYARTPVEVFCNRFAAGFLIPRSALRDILPSWPNTPVDWEHEVVSDWARKLKVSTQALALRLEELSLAPAGYYRRFAQGQRIVPRTEEGGGNYVLTQVSEMGMGYLSAVFRAMDKGTIQAGEAADMTHLSPRHFGSVRTQIDQRLGRPFVVSH